MEKKAQMIWSRALWLAIPMFAFFMQAASAAEFIKVEPAAPPSLVLKDLKGKSYNLAAHKGKVVLVNFWATWCPPCIEEMPSMQRLKEKMAGRPFVMLGVNSGEPRTDVDEFLKRIKVDFTILLDSDSSVTRRWKVFGLPTSFLVDRQGKVRYTLTGTTEWDSKDSVALIEGLLR
jgi:thiol-disulfide isomerase/thioredoxin